MPKTIESYMSVSFSKESRRNCFRIWGVALSFGLIWVAMIILAPIAKENGVSGFSSPIYGFFGYLCHQIPSRSFHIFEHQFAVCSRCFGVYLGVVVGFLVYPLFRSMDEAKPLPITWLFLSVVPIAIDWSLGVFGIWENTFFTRVSSGLILGIACGVFLVPAFVELAQMTTLRREGKKGAD